jgi:tRNA dimethylallyltransferase
MHKIVIVAGPTASGKSALALELAEKKNGVIINADSQQVYAELRILTARPSAEEEARVPHRLYGVLPASEACSAGKWLKLAKMEIDWALGEKKTPIVTGGTGLYIMALMQGIAEIPGIPPEVRAQARSDLEAMGAAAFYERLQAVDPAASAKIRASDPQRMTRAYEVWLGTGKPISWWHGQKNLAFYAQESFEVIKVEVETEELYRRCDARFDAMLKAGAVEEVRGLLALNLSLDLPGMRIIGVPELSASIKGEISLEEAGEKAKQATRNYAKRQATWFRNQLLV